MNNTNSNLGKQITEIIGTTYNYIENAIPLIKDLGDGFYQNANKETWNQLIDLFDGISWIIETLGEIDSIKNLQTVLGDYEIWNEYVQSSIGLNEVIKEMMEALENEDNILIGDLLLYEIVPVFEAMLEKLNILSPRVVPDIEN